MTIYTTEINRTESVRVNKLFNAKDRQHRTIGVYILTWEQDNVAKEDQTQGGYVREPGHYFMANVQATRNGFRYGSSQASHGFATAEERDAFVAKRVEASRKKAEK